MNVQKIRCKDIEFPKVSGDLRRFNKQFAGQLATAIKAEGMFNPLAVRPDPKRPGKYIGVQGKQRHHAVGKVLKEEYVDCNVLIDMDDTDAEMAMISENLWRNPLTKDQHLKSLKRWWEHFKAKYPEKCAPGVAGGQASARSRALINADGEAPEGEHDAPVADDADAGPGFATMFAASTGKSVSVAKREVRIARTFDADQLEAFAQMKTTQGDMGRIAGIKDKDKRDQVVSLIASGEEVQDALEAVLGEQAPVPARGRSKAVAQAEHEGKAEAATELTDDEWFDRFCSEKAAMLGDTAKFKADALLFRKTSDRRHAFRAQIKGAHAATKAGGLLGSFYYLMRRFISVSHPKDWLLCDECKGKGEKPDGSKCSKCAQGGYLLKTEEYL